MQKNVHKPLIVMKTLVLALVVLSAGLSAAHDPPEGQYIAQGVTYVGCFEHGQEHYEEVLDVQINEVCTFNTPTLCLTPSTCIDSCRNESANYVYVGLKYPGLCFCDSVLRGVTQMDSVDWSPCDGQCAGDITLACGGGYNMLVYRFSSLPQSTMSASTVSSLPQSTTSADIVSSLPQSTTSADTVSNLPQSTTSAGTGTTNSVSYKTQGGVETTSNKTDKMPQSNTALIAGAAAGGAAVLLVAGSVAGVCIWRKKSGRRQTDKPNSTLALENVSRDTSQPSSAPYSNPTVPPTPTNIDALYAKPDKKRKQKKMSTSDDPSYQDVIPTGAQHQYATVNDDHPPNPLVQQDSNPYDSIQNDPQYAVVHKGPKYRPNVDVNPIYMVGETEVSPDQEISGMTEMVDNVIYE